MQLYRNLSCLVVLSFSLVLSGCGGDSPSEARSGDGGSDGSAGASGLGGMLGSGGGAGNATGGSAGSGATGGASSGCFPVKCPDGKSYECGDCVDNDGDGLKDDKDAECLGPCDNTEGPVLQTGTPGEPTKACQADCYFEGGVGQGGGDCVWDRSCDPLEPTLELDGSGQCTYDADLVGTADCPATQDDSCLQLCGPLTPNGCDCFGCCTFPGADGYVFLGSETKADGGTCTLNELGDPDKCRPCTPVDACLNTCGRCELCLGKDTIPADCLTGGTGGAGGMGGVGGTGGSDNLRCDPGVQACGLPDDPPCPSGGFCLTGCCILVQ